jgi:hypothetical protein
MNILSHFFPALGKLLMRRVCKSHMSFVFLLQYNPIRKELSMSLIKPIKYLNNRRDRIRFSSLCKKNLQP